MKHLSVHREHLSLVCAILVMCLITINFAINPLISHSFESRFFVSGLILILLTIYFRFLPPFINAAYRALYRIAVVMSFWAFGFFLFPTPNLILYLIALPAFYFLYRIEVKTNIQNEDLITSGILLALSVLLYVQQQPLKVILFSETHFNWITYYKNAPILIFVGLGFMRLHKFSSWKGLALLGTLIFLTGIILTLALAFTPWNIPSLLSLSIIITAHGWMAVLWRRNPQTKNIRSFLGLSETQWEEYCSQNWLIWMMILQITVFLTAPTVKNVTIEGPFLVAGILFSLYRYRSVTLSLSLLESMAFFGFMGSFLFFEHQIFWQIPSAALLFLCVIIRRKESLNEDLPNIALSFGFLFYYLQLFGFVTLRLMDLGFILFPFCCWILIPNRPGAIKKSLHFIFWPILTALTILCTMEGLNPRWIHRWALITIIPAALFYFFIKSEWGQRFLTQKQWHLLLEWSETGDQALFYLSIGAFIASSIALISNISWFIGSWPAILELEMILLTGVIIFIYLAAIYNRIRHVMLAELYIWASLGLIRWKFDVLDQLNFGSPADGYFLLGAAITIAGIREILRDKRPIFTPYFQKMTFIYGLLGWLYLQILQFLTFGETKAFTLHGELSSILMAIINVTLLKTQRKRHIIVAFFFINFALLIFFFNRSFIHPMVYLFPLAISALILVQLFKEEISIQKAKKIRLIISLVICGTSAFYNLIDFSTSVMYPSIATLASTTIVVIGISLRVRIYLYLGTLFFIVNAIGTVANIVLNQPPDSLTLIIGLIFLFTGTLFTVSFLVFQMKRQEILDNYHKVMNDIRGWE